MKENNYKKTGKSEWLEVIEKSLKRGTMDDFVWDLGSDIKGEPFAHQEDVNDFFAPIVAGKKDNDWNIGLDYSLVDHAKNNDYLVSHTKFNLKSVILDISKSDVNFEKLLKNIDLESMEIIFNTPYGVDLIMFLENLKDCLHKNYYDSKKLNFTLRLPLNNPSLMPELSKYIQVNFPKLSFYVRTDRNLAEEPVQYITGIFKSLNKFIEKSQGDRNNIEWVLSNLKFQMFATDKFLQNIATLRAFKIVWNNYVKAFRFKQIEPKILLGINHDFLTEDDENDDMIIYTVACMSGAIAGVHAINMAVKENSSDEKNQMRKILNIQNMMKHESNMNIVSDALAGSYSIEDTTNKIATAVWKNL